MSDFMEDRERAEELRRLEYTNMILDKLMGIATPKPKEDAEQ